MKPTRAILDSVLATLFVLVTAVGVARGFGAQAASSSGAGAPVTAAPIATGESPDSLTWAVDLTVTNNPFRLQNAPTNVRFAETGMHTGFAPSLLPPKVRPSLQLQAIVGGPPWQALVGGLPGQAEPTVVAPGARFGDLVVRRITRDSVVIQASDTTWRLSMQGMSP